MIVKNDHLLQLKVTLKGTKPPIWRRIQIPCAATFWDLHVALQDAMGWSDHHLHEFEVRHPFLRFKLAVGIPDDEGLGEVPILPGWHVPVVRFLSLDNRKIDYTYDFGDGWVHVIRLEKIMPREEDAAYPRCLAGRRACPPEDCGGIGGYENLVAVLADPDHPEHAETRAWVGAEYDPGRFDKHAVVFDDPDERWQSCFAAAPEEEAAGPWSRVIDGGESIGGTATTGRGENWDLAGDLSPGIEDLRSQASRGFHGYPLATVVLYGPDDRRATKLAAGIVTGDSGEIGALERWTIREGDIRAHAPTAVKVLAFLRRHGARTVVLSDGILGCPHEEGIDYPTGQPCPRCPFWSRHDRWSGEPIH